MGWEKNVLSRSKISSFEELFICVLISQSHFKILLKTPHTIDYNCQYLTIMKTFEFLFKKTANERPMDFRPVRGRRDSLKCQHLTQEESQLSQVSSFSGSYFPLLKAKFMLDTLYVLSLKFDNWYLQINTFLNFKVYFTIKNVLCSLPSVIRKMHHVIFEGLLSWTVTLTQSLCK